MTAARHLPASASLIPPEINFIIRRLRASIRWGLDLEYEISPKLLRVEGGPRNQKQNRFGLVGGGLRGASSIEGSRGPE